MLPIIGRVLIKFKDERLKFKVERLKFKDVRIISFISWDVLWFIFVGGSNL